jgi:hypothetical protein
MKDKEKIALLKQCFDDTIWMAIRYAHSRSTYAPGMVRRAVDDFKKIFPDWEPKEDITIKPPTDDDLRGIYSRQDYLDDLFKKNNI